MNLRRWLAAALAMMLACCAGLALGEWCFGTVRIAGLSMADTLHSRDRVFVTRFDYVFHAPRRGDVVQCRFPKRGDTYVKRVIGLPGDTVVFTNGRLILNGEPVDEPYVRTPTDDYSIALGEDEYLLLGDNRADSYDSRMEDMGPVRRADIRGRVRWILLPLKRFGPVQ